MELRQYGFKTKDIRIIRIIDEAQKVYYTENQSEVIRRLIDAGADKIIGKEKAKQIRQETAE